MADADEITMRVARYRPDKDREPGWQEYTVPQREEWTVLDGLNHVKTEVDTTLAYRWSCRMGERHPHRAARDPGGCIGSQSATS